MTTSKNSPSKSAALPGWLANVAGVGVAGAVVVGGLFLGAPDVAANGPSNPLRLSAPRSTGHSQGEVPVGETLELWGQPSRLNMFWTSDTTDQIVRTYVDAWKAAGFEPRINKIDLVTHVAIVEASTGLMRSVTILEAGDQRTVLPGLTDIRVAPDLTTARAPVPIPSDASGYLAHVADDTNSVSYSASYAAPQLPSGIADYYRAEMTKLGYTERTNPDVRRIKNGVAVEFERGPEFVQIIANANDPTKLDQLQRQANLPAESLTGKASFVSLTHIRQIVQPGAKP